MMKYYIHFLLFFSSFFSFSQSFDLIPLGIYGGGDESNLSAYLLGEKDSKEFICLDAGNLRAGINKTIERGTFSEKNEVILRNYIKGYFISHGHLDHIAGMVINSPEDSKKKIYALKPVIDILKKYYFTNGPWTNFANEGIPPILNKYKYIPLYNLDTFKIKNTNLHAQVFKLSHGNPYISSAILVYSKNNCVLYLGDTGADRIEKSNLLDILWKNIAPKIKNHTLKAILIEVSFPNSQPENLLFGHLTPHLLFEELGNLAKYADKENLHGLNIIITHIKPDKNNPEVIKKELIEGNIYGVNLIFPQQGEKIDL